jgi:hypothetical protein
MLCGVMQIHWPQVFTEDGAYLSQMNLYTMLDVDPIGKILQPDQSPTFVETYLEMEKLLSTGIWPAYNIRTFMGQ